MSYFQSVKRQKNGMHLDGTDAESSENKKMYKEIKENQAQCLALTDEKLVVVEQSEREIENYLRQIDRQIARFRNELKDQGIEQKPAVEEPLAEASLATGSVTKSNSSWARS